MEGNSSLTSILIVSFLLNPHRITIVFYLFWLYFFSVKDPTRLLHYMIILGLVSCLCEGYCMYVITWHCDVKGDYLFPFRFSYFVLQYHSFSDFLL